MARPKKTEAPALQDLSPAVTVAAEPPAVVAVAQAPDLPSLADYIAAHERDGIVLCRVTYPGAQAHVFPGKFSGVIVSDGPPSRTYADGSTE